MHASKRPLLIAAGLALAVVTLACRAPSVAGPGIKLGPNASLGGIRPFPEDDPWNTDISTAPVDPNSDRLIASIGLDAHLHPDFGAPYQGAPNGIPYVVVSGNQPQVPLKFQYADESDPGPYPIPPDAPVEGGRKAKGDRHVIVIDRESWKIYELFAAYPDGKGGWRAGSGAIFDFKRNTTRPAGWTSADAAGLPIFPGLVRYDEVMGQGEIRHALRFTVRRTRRAYVAPARHWASRSTDPNLPPMGMRVRLKKSVDISRYPKEAQVILRALKKYGMLLADNGSPWFIQGTPDDRWNDGRLAAIKRIKGRDLEVVKMGKIVTR